MASSRRSSGSNSSNSQKGSQESKSSSSETEIILDLGVTNDIDEAEKKVKDWITDNLKKIKITGEWRPIWGIKFTKGITTDFSKSDGIQNLGKVIGQEYFVVGMRLTDGETTLASYRIDWDKIKGKHFNPEIPKIFPRQSFAYKFGNLDEDKIIDPETNKAPGEVEIINRMLVFTKMALQNNQLMSPLQAQLILSNFRIQSQSNRAYFRNFAELLRPLIEASLLAIWTCPY
jgi:hypothetical protein